jgi:hypothetical protein
VERANARLDAPIERSRPGAAKVGCGDMKSPRDWFPAGTLSQVVFSESRSFSTVVKRNPSDTVRLLITTRSLKTLSSKAEPRAAMADHASLR